MKSFAELMEIDMLIEDETDELHRKWNVFGFYCGISSFYNNIFTKKYFGQMFTKLFLNPGFQMNSINFIYPHFSQNMETICPFRIIHWYESSILNIFFII